MRELHAVFLATLFLFPPIVVAALITPSGPAVNEISTRLGAITSTELIGKFKVREEISRTGHALSSYKIQLLGARSCFLSKVWLSLITDPVVISAQYKIDIIDAGKGLAELVQCEYFTRLPNWVKASKDRELVFKLSQNWNSGL